MIALHPSVAYINEPFNIQHTPIVCKAKFDHWFTYICEINEKEYLKDIEECIQFKYPLYDAAKSITSLKDCAKLARDYILTLQHRATHKRALMKDPIALFSAEWLTRRFNMDAIILIRHPAAFVGSIKAADWSHPFNHFIEQPLLMKRLEKYRDQIEEYSKENKSSVDQAILLWNLIHYMIIQYQKNRPDWLYIRHEDLSENPVDEFKKIYTKLNLDFSENIENKMRSFTQADSSKGIKRDSRSNRWSWKNRLTKEEIAIIKEQTYEIASVFYNDKDWDE